MKITSEGLHLIKSFEGLKLEAYQDQAGVWTIGYGCTGGVKPGDKITREQAEAEIECRLEKLGAQIEKCVKVPINLNEFSALCSLAYNIGLQAFKDSTLLKLLNRHRRLAASGEFVKWCKINGEESLGLLRRRNAERALFLKRV